MIGTYTLNYTATDKASNQATATRTINVVAAPKFIFERIGLAKTEVLPTEPVFFDFTLLKQFDDFDQIQLSYYLSTSKDVITLDYGYGIDKKDFVET